MSRRLALSAALCCTFAACSSASPTAGDGSADAAPRDAAFADFAAPADLRRADQRPVGDGAADRGRDRSAADAARDGPAGPDLAGGDAGAFPTNRFGCMATVGASALLAVVGNVAVYGGCPSGTPGKYLLVWGGTLGAMTVADVSAMKAGVSAELFQIPGLQGHGTGLCCTGSTNQACLSLTVATNTSTVWDVAHALDAILVNEPLCLGIVAEVPGPARPRCQPGPECTAIPVCPPGQSDPLCCTVPPFDENAGRAPTLGPGAPAWDLELPQAPGECAHDGDCVLNGCGNHCNAYSAPSFVATCPCYGALKSSFCGCVGGECRWYEQQ